MCLEEDAGDGCRQQDKERKTQEKVGEAMQEAVLVMGVAEEGAEEPERWRMPRSCGDP